ncbi:MAG: sigma-70 family RNA polymerase sigma factor [Pseudomonadota bacterium]
MADDGPHKTSIRAAETLARAPKEKATASDLASIYRAEADNLTAYVRRAFGDGPPDPDDVVQEAFHRLVEQGDLASIDNYRAFLWRTARNLVFTYKRDEKVRSKYDFEVEQLFFVSEVPKNTPERVVLAKEQLRAVKDAIEAMPVKRRTALLLRRLDGLSAAEIAQRIGVSRRSVTKYLAQAALDLDRAVQDKIETKIDDPK